MAVASVDAALKWLSVLSIELRVEAMLCFEGVRRRKLEGREGVFRDPSVGYIQGLSEKKVWLWKNDSMLPKNVLGNEMQQPEHLAKCRPWKTLSHPSDFV